MFWEEQDHAHCCALLRIAAHCFIATTSIFGFFGSALAADMTGAEIKAFLSGKTAYLETTAASAGGQAGQVVIFWSADGTALYGDPVRIHHAWNMGSKGKYELHRLEGEARHGVRPL